VKTLKELIQPSKSSVLHVDEKDQRPTLDIYAELEAAALKFLAGTALSFRDKVNLIKTI